MKLDIRDIVKDESVYIDKDVILEGWIRNHRKQKDFGFIDFYDGTHFSSLQIVYDKDIKEFDDIQKYRVGSAIRVHGMVVKSPTKGQSIEIKATDVELVGSSLEDYPIQPKDIRENS